MKFSLSFSYVFDNKKGVIGWTRKKSLRRHSQGHGLSRALLDKVNQFLLLSSGLTFWK